MTQIAFVGNTTSAAELRFTQGGKAVANVTVAVNRKRGDQDETDYHRVTVWEGMAENLARLDKGTRVLVIGRLTSREFEDREGNKRVGWDVTADAIGPDLRFDPATVTRQARASAPQETTDDYGWPASTSTPGSGSQAGADSSTAEVPF